MKTLVTLLKVLMVVFLLSAAPGCRVYTHLMYGMTQPKEQTPEDLVGFLEKNKFPATSLYMFVDSASYVRMMKHPVLGKNLLTHMIFTRNGILLMRDTTNCQWWGAEFIRKLHPDSSYRTTPGLLVDEVLAQIKPFGKSLPPDTVGKNPDFTIIVTWARFLGKYNYRLFDLEKAVTANKNARIRLIWLNIDMQKEWHLTRHHKVSVR
ncbi:MAG: hypothetical protein WCO44_00330 [Bacteroidota bacterium]